MQRVLSPQHTADNRASPFHPRRRSEISHSIWQLIAKNLVRSATCSGGGANAQRAWPAC